MEPQEKNTIENGDKVIRTTSAFDCGGRCPLRFHVKKGKIIRIEGDDFEDKNKQLRACLRCRALRQYIYHPDRLKFPLKRDGPKGSGKFKRISWDEALDTIAEKLKETIEKYGNQSLLYITGGGYFGALHGAGVAYGRLLNALGGYTSSYGNISSCST